LGKACLKYFIGQGSRKIVCLFIELFLFFRNLIFPLGFTWSKLYHNDCVLLIKMCALAYGLSIVIVWLSVRSLCKIVYHMFPAILSKKFLVIISQAKKVHFSVPFFLFINTKIYSFMSILQSLWHNVILNTSIFTFSRSYNFFMCNNIYHEYQRYQ